MTLAGALTKRSGGRVIFTSILVIVVIAPFFVLRTMHHSSSLEILVVAYTVVVECLPCLSLLSCVVVVVGEEILNSFLSCLEKQLMQQAHALVAASDASIDSASSDASMQACRQQQRLVATGEYSKLELGFVADEVRCTM